MKKRFTLATLLAVSGALVLTYQNCAKQVFEDAKRPRMIINGGAEATNSTTVSVEFVNFRTDHIESFKVAEKSITLDTLPWKVFTDQSTASFEKPAGVTPNGIKTLEAELRKTDGKVIRLEAQIGYDTQAPNVDVTGILQQGLNGLRVSKGDQMSLDWDANDILKDDYQSGLSTVRAFWTEDEQCATEEGLFLASRPYTSATNLVWPKDRTEAFYVCVEVKDKAGNPSTARSEVLTGLWRSVAGKTFYGNGNDVHSDKVRVYRPGRLLTLNNSEIIVGDAPTKMVRKIDSNFIIDTILGNGNLSTPYTGWPGSKAIETGITVSNINLDSQKRLYFMSASSIYRIDTKLGKDAIIEHIVSNILIGKKSMTVDPESDTIYLAAYDSIEVDLDQAKSYIYKLSIAEHESQWPLEFDYSDAFWIGKRWAGNGKGVLTSTDWDDSDETGTVGYPRGMFAFAPGVLVYYSLKTTNASIPNGQHQLRMIRERKDASGNVIGIDNLSIAKQTDGQPVAWTSQINKDHHGNLLWVHHGPQVEKAQFTFGLNDPAPSLKARINRSTHTISLPGCAGSGCDLRAEGITEINRDGQYYYVSSDYMRGNIYLLNQSFEIVDTFARKADAATGAVLAKEAVIQNPDGVAQDKDNNVYIFEGNKSTVRKVYTNGSTDYAMTFAGTPFENEYIDIPVGTTIPLSDATFSSVKTTHGALGGLAYHENTNSLYVAQGVHEGHNQVERINLATNTIETVIKDPYISGVTPWEPTGDLWREYCVPTGIDLLGDQLFLGRVAWNTYNGETPAVYSKYDIGGVSGSLTRASDEVVVTNPSTTVPKKAYWAATSEAEISFYGVYIQGNSADSGLFVRKFGEAPVRLEGAVYQDIAVIEDATNYHLFMISGSTIHHGKVDKLTGSYSATDLKNTYVRQNLYLPGTFISSPRQIVASSDGGLFISDYDRGRVIEYFVLDESGNLSLVPQP